MWVQRKQAVGLGVASFQTPPWHPDIWSFKRIQDITQKVSIPELSLALFVSFLDATVKTTQLRRDLKFQTAKMLICDIWEWLRLDCKTATSRTFDLFRSCPCGKVPRKAIATRAQNYSHIVGRHKSKFSAENPAWHSPSALDNHPGPCFVHPDPVPSHSPSPACWICNHSVGLSSACYVSNQTVLNHWQDRCSHPAKLQGGYWRRPSSYDKGTWLWYCILRPSINCSTNAS